MILCAAERATQVALPVMKIAVPHFLNFLPTSFRQEAVTHPSKKKKKKRSFFPRSCDASKFTLFVQAIQCLGGNGYVNEYVTGRLLRDAKLYEIGAGTSEIRRIVIGRELFKEQ